MRVENNNSFVRGKGKSREPIEYWVLNRYLSHPRPRHGGPYELAIPYETDEDLDRTIYNMLAEAKRIADFRNGFIEADCISMDDPVRHW